MVATLAGAYSGGMAQLDTNKAACAGTLAGSSYATYTLPAAAADTTLKLAWNDTAKLVGQAINPGLILFVQWGQSRQTKPSVAATFSVKIKDVTLY
jgi:hypothetical protein